MAKNTKPGEESSESFAIQGDEAFLSPDQELEIPEERFDLKILRSIRKIMRSADIYSKQLALRHGITLPQILCLNKVVDLGPISVKRLAEEIFLSPSTIVGITDRLEKRGLVSRTRSSLDRRSVVIEATREGVQMKTEAPPVIQNAFLEALNQLPVKDQESMAYSLEKIVEMMEIKKVDAAPILETSTKLDK